MRAIILAAGTGSRLGVGHPKCMTQVGGHSLLHHQLAALRSVGVGDVTVVVGHQHNRIRSAGTYDLDLVMNERFATTNSLYSFWLARRPTDDDVLLLNSDVLFPLQVLEDLLAEPGSAVAYDSTSGGDPEHMKVALQSGRLTVMSKMLAAGRTCGENLGVIRLSAAAANTAFAAADALIHGGADADWVASAVNAAASEHWIGAADMAGMPWIEIDFPPDLTVARRRIWPRIVSMQRSQILPDAPTASRCDHDGSVRLSA